MPKLVAMLRVKDGILFIEEWLERTTALVDEIVVVDNGSTDGTLEILQRHPKVVSLEQTEGFDEGRDKILAYQRARERKPDWVISLDVDEIFEERITRDDLDRMMSSRFFVRYFFSLFHLVDLEHFNVKPFWFRVTTYPTKVMWKEQPTGYFANLKFNNGLIRGIHGPTGLSHFRIRHLGYVDKSYVKRKAQIYRIVDPSMEDTYERMEQANPYTWRWREYNEAPMMVTAQNLLMDAYFLFLYSISVPQRILRRFAQRPSGDGVSKP